MFTMLAAPVKISMRINNNHSGEVQLVRGTLAEWVVFNPPIPGRVRVGLSRSRDFWYPGNWPGPST